MTPIKSQATLTDELKIAELRMHQPRKHLELAESDFFQHVTKAETARARLQEAIDTFFCHQRIGEK